LKPLEQLEHLEPRWPDYMLYDADGEDVIFVVRRRNSYALHPSTTLFMKLLESKGCKARVETATGELVTLEEFDSLGAFKTSIIGRQYAYNIKQQLQELEKQYAELTQDDPRRSEFEYRIARKKALLTNRAMPIREKGGRGPSVQERIAEEQTDENHHRYMCNLIGGKLTRGLALDDYEVLFARKYRNEFREELQPKLEMYVEQSDVADNARREETRNEAFKNMMQAVEKLPDKEKKTEDSSGTVLNG